MARPTRFEHFRWLGDKRSLAVHDLDNITPDCDLDDLLASQAYATFGPDILLEAKNRCYKPCRHCVAANSDTAA